MNTSFGESLRGVLAGPHVRRIIALQGDQGLCAGDRGRDPLGLHRHAPGLQPGAQRHLLVARQPRRLQQRPVDAGARRHQRLLSMAPHQRTAGVRRAAAALANAGHARHDRCAGVRRIRRDPPAHRPGGRRQRAAHGAPGAAARRGPAGTPQEPTGQEQCGVCRRLPSGLRRSAHRQTLRPCAEPQRDALRLTERGAKGSAAQQHQGLAVRPATHPGRTACAARPICCRRSRTRKPRPRPPPSACAATSRASSSRPRRATRRMRTIWCARAAPSSHSCTTSTTREQRANAVRVLKGYEDDLRVLSAQR